MGWGAQPPLRSSSPSIQPAGLLTWRIEDENQLLGGNLSPRMRITVAWNLTMYVEMSSMTNRTQPEVNKELEDHQELEADGIYSIRQTRWFWGIQVL